jgi:glycosyltransferase involved in cell wall biosynthesis
MIKVSVITVSFNAQATIEQTIQSVLSQTYENIEYVIWDGQSTDQTLQIIHRHQDRISKIICEKDKSLYDAMNKATAHATGDYVYFLNADDRFVDEHVVAQAVEACGEQDMVFGDVLFYYPSEERTVRISRQFSIDDLKHGMMPPHQGTFIKKSLMLQFPYDLQYRSAADFDFYCKAALAGKTARKIDHAIAIVQIGGISSGKASYLETCRIVKQYFGWMSYLQLKLKHVLYRWVKAVLGLVHLNLHRG